MVLLRELVISTDMPKIFNLFSDSETQFLFINTLQIKSKEDFTDWFRYQLINRYHEFKVISDKDGNFAGFCYSYDYTTDGTVKTAVCVDKDHRNSGIGAAAEIVFIDELFTKYPIRKVYNHVYAYNKQSLKSNLDGGFAIEGQLKEYRYLNGEYHDMFILAITRKEFYARHEKILNHLRKG